MTGPKPVLDSGVGSNQGIWEAVTDPVLRVGTRGSLSDGRVFYYARNSSSSNFVTGMLLQSELINAQNEDLAVNTAEIGDSSLTITFGTDTANANDYVGGYVVVIDGTGEGITYEIASHPAVTSGGSIVFQLVDPIYIAFAATTTVCVMKNFWMDLVKAAANDVVVPIAGINQVEVPRGDTNAQYFWSQTWGISAARTDAIIAQGSTVVHAIQSASSGRVGFATGEMPGVVGTQLFTGTETERGPIFLKISQ